MFDLAIRSGTIIDGKGSKPYRADVYVSNGKIACISTSDEKHPAREAIDASEQIISPGFIDSHSHDDFVFGSDPYNTPKLTQGVTTVIVGNCGMGTAVAPQDSACLYEYESGVIGKNPLQPPTAFSHYLTYLQEALPAMNVGILVGHIPLRVAITGFASRPLTLPEIQKLEDLASECIEQGALGLSTGLMYQPIYHAKTQELVALGRVASRSKSILTFHMRDYSANLTKALEEVCHVAQISAAKVQVSHLRAGGKSNRGKPRKAIEFIETAIQDGIDIGFDDYPYTAGASLLSQILPQWLIDGGTGQALERLKDSGIRRQALDELNGLSSSISVLSEAGANNILILGVRTQVNKKFEGMTISDIANRANSDPAEILLRLYEEEEGHISIAADWFAQDDVNAVIEHPLSIVISDGIHTEGKPHPRLFGAFPKFLRNYAINGSLRLEEAIRKITSAPANRYGLGKIGAVETGYQADFVIFDPKSLRDNATYNAPTNLAEGITYVIVNGCIVLKNGQTTRARPGRILMS